MLLGAACCAHGQAACSRLPRRLVLQSRQQRPCFLPSACCSNQHSRRNMKL